MATMDGRHAATFEEVFLDPVSKEVAWDDLEALLGVVGLADVADHWRVRPTAFAGQEEILEVRDLLSGLRITPA